MSAEPVTTEPKHPVHQLTTSELSRYAASLSMRSRGSLPMHPCKLSYAESLTRC
jgi:hypothetical protein